MLKRAPTTKKKNKMTDEKSPLLYCVYCARKTTHRGINFFGGVRIPICKSCKPTDHTIKKSRAEEEPEYCDCCWNDEDE